MNQEVKYINNSSEKLIQASLEKIINAGYHIDQVLQLSKTSFMVIISK